MAREYFNAYHSYLEAIEPLNDAERGRLFTACLFYSMTGEVPELRGNERFVFAGMRSQIDRDSKQYENRCVTNRKNGALGVKPSQVNATKRYRTLPNAPQRPLRRRKRRRRRQRRRQRRRITVIARTNRAASPNPR